MRRIQFFFPAIIALLTVFLVVHPAFSDSIKDRMASRLPTINALKAKGIVGENNKGYLEFRGAKQNADVVSAENSDRALVYGAIAKKQGATAELVGKRRAKQIEDITKPGQWLQKPDGSWYKK